MIRRILFAALLLVAAIAAVLAWLVTTTAGARQGAALAERFVSGLELSVADGSLWQGLTVSAVRYRQPGVTIAVDEATLRWRPMCLLDGEVCIDRLATRGLDIGVDTAAMPAAGDDAADSTGTTAIAVPLRIAVASVVMRDSRARIDDREIAFDRLRTGLSLWASDLRLAPTELSGLRVHLPAPAADAQGAGQEPAVASSGSAPLPADFRLALPEVSLPLAVHVSRLLLTDAALVQGGQRWPISRLLVRGEAVGGRAEVETFDVRTPQGRIEANGEVGLGGDWALTMHARVRSDAPPGLPGPQTVELQADGSLADLSVTMALSGAVKAELDAHARLFTAGVPWRLELEGSELAWPLAGAPTVRVPSLSLAAEGDVTSWSAQLATRVEGPAIPAGDWRLDARGDLRSAEVERLAGDVLGGELRADGQVGWADGVEWQATVNAEGLQPGRYREDLDGTLGGELATSGAMTAEGLRLSVDVDGIEGTLRGYPVALEGSVSQTPAGVWRFSGLRLRSGPDEVTVDGELADQWDARARLDLPELAALWPGLAGSVSGTATVTGPPDTPTVNADIEGGGIAYQDLRVDRLTLDASVRELLRGASEVRLRAAGLARGGEPLGEVRLGFDGTLGDHALSLAVSGEAPVTGQLGLRGALTAATGAWSGRLTDGRLVLPDGAWRLDGAPTLAWRPSSRDVRLDSHCWRRDGASLCLPEPLRAGPGGASATAELSGFPVAALKPWLPPQVAWSAEVDASARVQWSGAGWPRAQLEARTTPGRIRAPVPEGGEPAMLAYETLSLRADLTDDGADLALNFASEALGAADVEARVDPRVAGMPVAGQVSVDGVRLGLLQPFLPQLRRLEGTLSADGELSGALRAPAFDGEVRLRDGAVGIANLPIPIEDIELTATVQGNAADIDGGLRSGEGTARIGGSVAWADGVSASVALVGDGLEVAYPPMVRMALSPAMTINYDGESLSVNGRLSVPTGRITLRELPAQAVSVSKDVVVVDSEQNGEEEAAGEGGLKLSTNVYLVLGDDVRFSGFGADAGLTGALQLRQVGTDGAEAFGEVSLVDGTFERYGQRLEIRTGEFIFAGPIAEPRIRLEAVRRVDSVLAGLRVTGRPDALEATVFSEPTMAQADALTYLITGRAPGSGSPSEEALVAQAALGLGLLGGRSVGSSLADQLGVEDFQMEATGTGEDTQVAVSGYIAPNLLVRYGVGVFSPANTLTLRYYLSEQLYLEAVSGVANALDIFYSFDF